MNTRVADGRPLSREGRVGCRALCTNVPGPSLEPVLQFPLCNASSVGARAPKFFNREGGGVPRVTGSQYMEILLLALCKNGGGSLWMGSKRQIDLYLSNDQTRRHPQRKFRDFRVKTNCI
jgi:hypothetical protein